jgi:uncharacterized lipoprotein YmbA
MISNRAKFACCALTALMLTGCAGKVRYPDYHMLALAPSNDPPAADSQKLPAIAVQRFETPAYLRQGRIVYRDSPEQIGFYNYHRWASEPGQLVTTAMIDTLRSVGGFSVVEPYDGREREPYLLQGRLERLDEVDYSNRVQVEVRLSAQLLNTKTGTTIWAGDTTKTAQVDQRQVNSVVRSMGQVTQQAIEQLVQDMQKQLSAATIVARNPTVSP